MASARPIWPVVVLLWALLLVGARAEAAPFDPGGHDWEGYADLVDLARARLGAALVLTQHLDFGRIRPEDAMILVYPESHLDVDSLASFLGSGGRVVLLDDFGTGDKLLRRFDITRVPLPPVPLEALRHNPELAIAEPVGNNELVRDVTRVVVNHATGFTHPALTPLLEVRSKAGGPDGTPGAATAVGLVGQTTRGKLVAIGDPSALMNAMLRYPGNAQLARNLVQFVDRSGGKVYLSVGAFEQSGTFAGPSQLSDATRDAKAGLSSSIASAFGPRLTQILAAFIGLGVVVWIGSAAGRTYRMASPRLTRIIPLFLQGGAAGHAAVVGARRAPREVALLEIGKALEEEVSLVLGLPRVPLHEELVGRLLAAGLIGRATASPLRKLLSDVTHIDTLISAGRGAALPRVTDDDVLAAAEVAAKITAEVRAKARLGRAA